MRNKHQKTLQAIFSEPVKSNIVWKDVESMLLSLGADLEAGAGSRICVELNGVIAVFHRPHPRKETDKGAVKALQRFLIEAEINYA